MRGFLFCSLLSALFAFVLGVGLSFLKPPAPPPVTLTLLTQRGYFPPEILEEFKNNSQIQVRLEECNSVADQLRKLKDSSDIDLVHFQASQARFFDSIDFVPKQEWGIKEEDLSGVSVDFTSLPKIRTSRNLLPLTWNVTGILKTKTPSIINSKEPSRLPIFLPKQKVLSFLLFNRVLQPDWLVLSQIPELEKALSDIRSRFTIVSPPELPNGAQSLYTTNGAAGWLLENKTIKNWVFDLAEERSVLDLDVLGVRRQKKTAAEAAAFIQFILRPQIALKIAEHNASASTHTGLNSRKMSPYLKANFIRRIRIGRLHIFNDPWEEEPPIWNQIYTKSLADTGRPAPHGE